MRPQIFYLITSSISLKVHGDQYDNNFHNANFSGQLFLLLAVEELAMMYRTIALYIKFKFFFVNNCFLRQVRLLPSIQMAIYIGAFTIISFSKNRLDYDLIISVCLISGATMYHNVAQSPVYESKFSCGSFQRNSYLLRL